MTDQKGQKGEKKKKLTLSRPGKLELNKTIDAGQVRQSFSHGRTKSVAVEVRRKRTFKQSDDGAMTEVREVPSLQEEVIETVKTVEPEKPVENKKVRTLTEQERAARMRALEGAFQTETEIAESRAEREAMEVRRREEETRKRKEEERLPPSCAARSAAEEEGERKRKGKDGYT